MSINFPTIRETIVRVVGELKELKTPPPDDPNDFAFSRYLQARGRLISEIASNYKYSDNQKDDFEMIPDEFRNEVLSLLGVL